jgi:hypothetical protein
MTYSISPNAEPAGSAVRHFQQPEEATSVFISTNQKFRLATPMKKIQQFKDPLCARPFDQWKAIGGGAGYDTFRRFNILAVEEKAFLVHWAKKCTGQGVLSRNETGTLVFRISSTDSSGLVNLDIGRSDSPEVETQWLHVYDEEGVSWLTQFACTDAVHFPTKIYDSFGRPFLANGKIGRYGPSGLTVPDFVEQYLENNHTHVSGVEG